MEKLLWDPLSQPLESYLELLNGISQDFKTWLKELGAGRRITSRQFEVLKSGMDDLPRVAGMAEEQKALFLFRNWKTLRCFEAEKLENERLKIIPSLFFKERGTFRRYAGPILPEIKAYAETCPAFKDEYETAKKSIREKSSAAGRMETYLHSNGDYPLALVAELEGIAESDLVPELLPFLYWGKTVYLVICRLERGDAGEGLYRKIPRWNCGNHSFLPFIGYAAIKQDLKILTAIFEGIDGAEVMRILARLFYTNNGQDTYRFFENWLDKAVIQDFYEENFGGYRKGKGLNIAPGEEDTAGLFLEYGIRFLEQTTGNTALQTIRMFFPGAAAGEDRGIMEYLDGIENTGKNEAAYWRLIKTIVERAALYPPAELWPRKRFGTCTGIGKTTLYLFEMYLRTIKPDRESLLLLGPYIRVVLECQPRDAPKPLVWLFKYTPFADYCGPFINEPDFLKALLAAAGDVETFSETRRTWINFVVTVWLCCNYRNRKPDPVWPVRTGEEAQFDDADGEDPLYTAAALLFSEGEIKAEPVLLDCIRDLFSAEKAKGFVGFNSAFIPYRYFIRTNEDEEKNEAMIREARDKTVVDLLVMRRLRGNKKFNFSDFILRLDDVEKIETLPQNVFDRYHITFDEAVLRYLERHGNTFETADRIAAFYKGSGTADTYISRRITKAAEEAEPAYLHLFTLLVLYNEGKDRINKLLDKDPEKAAIIIKRCKIRLAALRKIPGTGMAEKRGRYYYLTAFYAAYFIASRASCWTGLKPLLLAFRHADMALLETNLRPAGGIEENIAAQIDRFLRGKWEDKKMKALRRDMANDFSDCLKLRKRRRSAAGPRNGGPGYGSHERGLEGFNLNYTEPNPLWRYAYVRSLGDLAVDSNGSGRLIHHILHRAAEHDPSPQVREWAGKMEEQLNRIRNGCKEGSHNRRLIHAFWWIRWAHIQTLNIPFDEAAALKTRNTEYQSKTTGAGKTFSFFPGTWPPESLSRDSPAPEPAQYRSE